MRLSLQDVGTVIVTVAAVAVAASVVHREFGGKGRVSFSDFECPYCRTFQSSLDSVRHDRGNAISFVFVHFPLPMHRFARPAARAAECANTLGKFDAFQRVLFGKQDSLGLKPWGSYPNRARERLAIRSCPDGQSRTHGGPDHRRQGTDSHRRG
jgi:hypothetical protein